MEHLDLRPDPRLQLLPVPLLVGINGQLNSNFHTFHLGGQDVVLSEDGTRLMPNQTPSGFEGTAGFKLRCSKFVQGWLYFEVL